MDSGSKLKREMFANEKRCQNRQQKLMAIRKQFHHNLPEHIRDPCLNINYLRELHQKCRQQQFSLESLQQLTHYILESCNRIMLKENILLLQELFHFLKSKREEFKDQGDDGVHLICWFKFEGCCCQCYCCGAARCFLRVMCAIEEILILESNEWINSEVIHEKSQNHGSSHLIDQNYEMSERFYEITKIMAILPQSIILWPKIAILGVKDKRYCEFAIQIFSEYIIQVIFNPDTNFEDQLHWNGPKIIDQHLTIILNVVKQFLKGCNSNEQLKQNVLKECLHILDNLMKYFQLRGAHMISLIETATEAIAVSKSSIEIMNRETEIYINICSVFQKKQLRETKIQIIDKASFFVGRMYSTEDEDLCRKTYLRNINIFKHLRSWLPVPPNLTKQMFEQTSLVPIDYTKLKCSRSILYAFSQIIVSDTHFVEYILNSDIYLAFLILYKILPAACRLEIVHNLYNMTLRSDERMIVKILEHRVVEILCKILEERDPSILMKGMGIIWFILERLPKEKEESNAQSYYRYCKFKNDMCSSEGRWLLQSHLISKIEEISLSAGKILKALEEK